MSSRSTASRCYQVPLALARCTAANPADAILPAAVSRSTRALFEADQALRDCRGAKYSFVRS